MGVAMICTYMCMLTNVLWPKINKKGCLCVIGVAMVCTV